VGLVGMGVIGGERRLDVARVSVVKSGTSLSSSRVIIPTKLIDSVVVCEALRGWRVLMGWGDGAARAGGRCGECNGFVMVVVGGAQV
jgi:hypothetical protein